MFVKAIGVLVVAWFALIGFAMVLGGTDVLMTGIGVLALLAALGGGLWLRAHWNNAPRPGS